MKRLREKYGFYAAITLMAVLIIVLVRVWLPSEAEKDVFRTRTINPPALGHWIHTLDELKAVRAELYAIEARVEALPRGGYTAELHHADQKRVLMIEKSLAPIDGGITTVQMIVPASSAMTGEPESYEAAGLYRGLVIETRRVMNDLVNVFLLNSTMEERGKAAELNEAAGLFQLSMKQAIETDYHAGPFTVWMLKTHIESMGIVFLFFLLRAEIIGQKRRILVYDAPRTLFWMLAWPVGIWRYPTKDPVALVRLVRHRLAMAMSFLFTVAVPNFALAQSGKADSEKKGDSGHTLVIDAVDEPANSLALVVEGVDKYHGMAVGEIFDPKPAPRLLARYTRSTKRGDVYLDSWNSAGSGFNNEADIGVGYTRSGWDVFYARYFIRGGDVGQIAVTKSGAVSVGKVKLPLAASGTYYFGMDSSSPPGGVVVKLSSGVSHRLAPNIQLSHRVAVGIDNNPFNLGDGVSAVGFYTAEVGFWKNAYFSWNASAPIRGQDNTTRGFRQSISGGYRHAWAW